MIATYLTTEPTFMDGQRIAAGTTVEYVGAPGIALAPLDASAVIAKANAVTTWLARRFDTGPLSHNDVLRAARSLGFQSRPDQGTTEVALAFIRGWLADPRIVKTVAEQSSVVLPSSFESDDDRLPLFGRT